jgi:solute carrier family 5 (sodium-coupled monocarboxylate transporter), member 8/12
LRYHFIPDEAMSMLAINETTAPMNILPSSSVEMETTGFQIYHISYLWYTLVGSSICIIVSLIISYATGPNDPAALNPKLLAPFVRKLIKSSRRLRRSGGIKSCGIDESIL